MYNEMCCSRGIPLHKGRRGKFLGWIIKLVRQDKDLHLSVPTLIRKQGLFIILPIIAFTYFSWGSGIGARYFDEGYFLYGADCILHGLVPYRDFFTIYFPGQIYLLALIFKLFGDTLFVERVFSVIVFSFLATIVFITAKRMGAMQLALISWLLAFLWFGAFGFLYFATPAPTALVFSQLSCLFFLDFLSSSHKKSLFFAGIFAAITALFRQDFGLYLILSSTAVGLVFIFRSVRSRGREPAAAFYEMMGFGHYFFAFLLLFVPAGLFFFIKAPLEDLLFDLVQWPLVIQPRFISIPYPPPLPDLYPLLSGEQSAGSYLTKTLLRVPFYFSIMIFASALLLLIKLPEQLSRWNVSFILILGLFYLNLARERSDLAHLYPATIQAAILLPALLSRKNGGGRRAIFLRTIVLVVSLLMIGSLALHGWRSLPVSTNGLISPQLRRARGLYLHPATAGNLELAVKFIRSHSSEDERIFVGNYRHDVSTMNDIMFYFFSERQSATKYHAIGLGLGTLQKVQEVIVRDLDRHANYIVIWTASKNHLTAETSQGVLLVDEYIRAHYQPIRRFGDYLVLRRRSI